METDKSQIEFFASDEEFREHVIATVAPEVIEALGIDIVMEIEGVQSVIGTLKSVIESKPPFEERKTAYLDFLPESDRQNVAELLEIQESALAKRGLQRVFHFRSARKLTEVVYGDCRLEADAASSIVDGIKSSLDERSDITHRAEESLESFAAVYELDPSALTGLLATLYQAADKLPSDRELAVIDGVNNSSKILLEASNPVSALAARGIKERTDWKRYSSVRLRSYVSKVKNIIKITHNRIIAAAMVEQVYWGVVAVSRVDEQKHRLQAIDLQSVTDEERAAIIAAEGYLVQKAAFMDEAFQIYKSHRNPADKLAKRLRRMIQPTLAESEDQKQRTAELELARDFNRSVTEVRDTIKGGRRLKAKGLNVAEVHDGLSRIEDQVDQGKLLSAEERGLILSILTDKFDDLVWTVRRISSPEPDQARAVIERERPEVLRLINNFDLDFVCENLLILFEDDEKVASLEGLLGAHQINSVRDKLREHLGFNDSGQVDSNAEIAEGEFELDGNIITELDWTVLPQGESELEDAARQIVADAKARAAKGFEVDIDLERLNILNQIKNTWGADRCYYARGSLSGRKRVFINGQDRPDEYIVLVMQVLDAQGQVKTEHAIAESPIAGHNALYVFRGDASPFSWREVYSFPKKDARLLGARSVRHTAPEGEDLIDSMSEKVSFLLAASPDEFHKIRFSNGQIKIHS